ncbi:unnamed protein product [Cuscuta epithymum]|uniref:ResB-like domain-containing protein n=1 Tax=Cuscuta epithymum TaxID=186058 RepID=A0AAV0EJL7_9ASTE|nr:unnamed protein product [Cuscuta epithymum]
MANFSSSSLSSTQLRNPKLNCSVGVHFSSRNSRIYYVFKNKSQNFSFTLSCKLNITRKNQGEVQKSVPRKIKLPESDIAPKLLEVGDAGNGNSPMNPPPVRRSKAGGLGLLRIFPKRVVSILANLSLAIAEMFILAVLMTIGSLIQQGQAPDFYFHEFPENNPLFGFFSWRWVLTLGFDHMFSSPLFLGTSALLGASLMACSYTTQIPLVKVARRWSFIHSTQAIRKNEYSDTLVQASVRDLGVILMGAGYEVFLKGSALYAFKGLAGRIAPIGVHLALLLVMSGGTLSATGSFRGSVNVPQGLNFIIGDILEPTGFLSTPSEAFNTEVHVNRFYMDYADDGQISQFRTDLSLNDLDGKEVMRKTISVNDPLRYCDITIYQTDWSFSALQIMKDDEGPFNLAMAPLKINGDKKLFGTFLPVGDVNSPNVKGISMLARDLQSIILYDKEGKFAGVRRPNSMLPIEIDGTKVEIVDAIGSTGLELKTDPGVPVVYAGFGALMLSTCISYLSHDQIWALQDGTSVVVGGKTNRAKAEFRDAISRLLDEVPEIVESSSSKESSDQ